MSQSADTADADADEDVDVELESICFHVLPPLLMNMQSQCDSGCVDLKKNEEGCVDLNFFLKSCVVYLWLTQSFWTNVQMPCLDLK